MTTPTIWQIYDATKGTPSGAPFTVRDAAFAALTRCGANYAIVSAGAILRFSPPTTSQKVNALSRTLRATLEAAGKAMAPELPPPARAPRPAVFEDAPDDEEDAGEASPAIATETAAPAPPVPPPVPPPPAPVAMPAPANDNAAGARPACAHPDGCRLPRARPDKRTRPADLVLCALHRMKAYQARRRAAVRAEPAPAPASCTPPSTASPGIDLPPVDEQLVSETASSSPGPSPDAAHVIDVRRCERCPVFLTGDDRETMCTPCAILSRDEDITDLERRAAVTREQLARLTAERDDALEQLARVEREALARVADAEDAGRAAIAERDAARTALREQELVWTCGTARIADTRDALAAVLARIGDACAAAHEGEPGETLDLTVVRLLADRDETREDLALVALDRDAAREQRDRALVERNAAVEQLATRARVAAPAASPYLPGLVRAWRAVAPTAESGVLLALGNALLAELGVRDGD